MYAINRSVAVIKPRQPYVDWINNNPDDDFVATLDDAREECTVWLMPDECTKDDVDRILRDGLYEDVFENELNGWWTERSYWPKNRTYDMFTQWFDVEVHSVVIDPWDDEVDKRAW